MQRLTSQQDTATTTHVINIRDLSDEDRQQLFGAVKARTANEEAVNWIDDDPANFDQRSPQHQCLDYI